MATYENGIFARGAKIIISIENAETGKGMGFWKSALKRIRPVDYNLVVDMRDIGLGIRKVSLGYIGDFTIDFSDTAIMLGQDAINSLKAEGKIDGQKETQ